VYLARGIHPYRENKFPCDGWAVSVSYEVQRDVAQKKILKYLRPEWIDRVVMHSGSQGSPGYGVIDYIAVRNVGGGISIIAFKSYDQGREKFQGASLDYVWLDEEPPKDIYEECRMRVFDKRGDVFCTMTPLKGLTWVYDEIYLNGKQNNEIWHINMEWADNPWLDKSEIELMEATLPADLLDSRKHGKFSGAGGLVYADFDESVHVIEPFDIPAEWQDMISIDPGLNNPLSCHFYAVDFDGNIYVTGEHYEKEREIDYHAEKIHQLADRLNWYRDSKGRLVALIDSAASQRTLASVRSVAELFFERDIAVNTNVNKDMYTGIARVQSLFKKRPPAIYIFKSCVNLIRELKGYWWGDGDTPRKKDDHALDELRYYVMSRPEPNKHRAPKTIVERDKEKLIRKRRS
jgi:phage terminase large subunit-like protein